MTTLQLHVITFQFDLIREGGNVNKRYNQEGFFCGQFIASGKHLSF